MVTLPRDRQTIEDDLMERRTESREIFATHRDALGSVVLLGDSLIAIGVPIALWDHAHPAWLIGWSIVVVLSSYGWEMVQRLYPRADQTDGQIRDRFGWVSTIAWGLLPWIVWGARDQGDVIWALVFVVVFGIASDLLYQSPTDAPSFDLMLATYGGSYLVAFAVAGEVLAVAATLLSAATFYAAAKVWLDVNDVLMERRARLEDETRRDPLTGLGTRISVNEALDALQVVGQRKAGFQVRKTRGRSMHHLDVEGSSAEDNGPFGKVQQLTHIPGPGVAQHRVQH